LEAEDNDDDAMMITLHPLVLIPNFKLMTKDMEIRNGECGLEDRSFGAMIGMEKSANKWGVLTGSHRFT